MKVETKLDGYKETFEFEKYDEVYVQRMKAFDAFRLPYIIAEISGPDNDCVHLIPKHMMGVFTGVSDRKTLGMRWDSISSLKPCDYIDDGNRKLEVGDRVVFKAHQCRELFIHSIYEDGTCTLGVGPFKDDKLYYEYSDREYEKDTPYRVIHKNRWDTYITWGYHMTNKILKAINHPPLKPGKREELRLPLEMFKLVVPQHTKDNVRKSIKEQIAVKDKMLTQPEVHYILLHVFAAAMLVNLFVLPVWFFYPMGFAFYEDPVFYPCAMLVFANLIGWTCRIPSFIKFGDPVLNLTRSSNSNKLNGDDYYFIFVFVIPLTIASAPALWATLHHWWTGAPDEVFGELWYAFSYFASLLWIFLFWCYCATSLCVAVADEDYYPNFRYDSRKKKDYKAIRAYINYYQLNEESIAK